MMGKWLFLIGCVLVIVPIIGIFCVKGVLTLTEFWKVALWYEKLIASSTIIGLILSLLGVFILMVGA